jgi:hypothetical protein
MKEIQFTELLPEIVTEINKETSLGSHIPLFIRNDLPTFLWPDNSLHVLISAFIDQAASLSDPGKPVRIAVCKRNKLADIEALLEISPSYWIQLRIDVPSFCLLEWRVQESLKDSGFRYEGEWTTEDEGSRLLTYSYGNQPVLFWIQKRRATHSYSFLMPVHESGGRC